MAINKQDSRLPEILAQHPLIIGIGNELRGDDAAGIELVRRLDQAGYSPTLLVYTNPENYLRRISQIPHTVRLWVDIVHLVGRPGEFRILQAEEIDQVAISTHNFSLTVVFRFLQETHPADDFLLGIQPKSTELGAALSQEVSQSISAIARFILEVRRTKPNPGKK